MINSIDLFASFKARQPGEGIRKAEPYGNSAERAYSFRDSLKEASHSYEREGAGIRREMYGRSGTKLRKLDNRTSDTVGRARSEKEPKEKQLEEVTARLEEILSILQSLTGMQQSKEQTPEPTQEMPEAIKSALQKLMILQDELERLTDEDPQLREQLPELKQVMADLGIQLEEVLNRLKAEGTTDKDMSFLQKLETAIAETLPKLEAVNDVLEKSSMGQDKAEDPGDASAAAADRKADAESRAMGADSRDYSERSTMTGADAAADSPKEGSSLQKAGTTAETPEKESKEEISILESKTEKITVQAKEKEAGENTADTDKEAMNGTHKAAISQQGRTSDETVIPLSVEQTSPAEASEAVSEPKEMPKANTASRAEIINQIVKKAEILVTDSQTEMRMQLEPENLGRLTLKIAVERGLITAKFTAESNEVKQVLESSFNELKDILQEKGLAVQNFSVSVGQENKEYNNDNSFRQWKESTKLNAGERNRAGYEGYFENAGEATKVVNPYIVHNGEFDHIA